VSVVLDGDERRTRTLEEDLPEVRAHIQVRNHEPPCVSLPSGNRVECIELDGVEGRRDERGVQDAGLGTIDALDLLDSEQFADGHRKRGAVNELVVVRNHAVATNGVGA